MLAVIHFECLLLVLIVYLFHLSPIYMSILPMLISSVSLPVSWLPPPFHSLLFDCLFVTNVWINSGPICITFTVHIPIKKRLTFVTPSHSSTVRTKCVLYNCNHQLLYLGKLLGLGTEVSIEAFLVLFLASGLLCIARNIYQGCQ